MVDDWVIKTMYATKRRRRLSKNNKRGTPGKETTKSNPSKRHRERLNGELDHLASLLPFDQSVIAKLDKLSILRLAVSYCRIKAFFRDLFTERMIVENRLHSHFHHYPFDQVFTETEALMQALGGFLFIITCEGEVFFASKTVEYYLGFHQSDIIHQSVLELIHSEDRDEFRRQLNWKLQLPKDSSDVTPQLAVTPEYSQYMQRCFTVRFRCLLDNTSGFITLEISGRIQKLFGYPKNNEDNNNSKIPLALFAVCSPFGPIPSLDAAQKDLTFKTKHKLDMNLIGMDVRAKVILNYSDKDITEVRFYQVQHPSDLFYISKGHEKLLKSGALGFLVYRWLDKQGKWIWLQTSLKVLFKNNKADCIMCTHRQLSEEEGKELLTKRNVEYKLPFPLLEPETCLGDDMDPYGDGSKRSKNRNQLKDYLQASRKRKAPYRDIGYGSYSPFTSLAPFNGHSSLFCSYPNSSFLSLDGSDPYRQGFSGSNAPHSNYYGYGMDNPAYQSLGFSYQPGGSDSSYPGHPYSSTFGFGMDFLRMKLDPDALQSYSFSNHQSASTGSTGPTAFSNYDSYRSYAGSNGSVRRDLDLYDSPNFDKHSGIPVSVVRNSSWKESNGLLPAHHHHPYPGVEPLLTT